MKITEIEITRGLRVYDCTENGYNPKTQRYSVPACRVKAVSFIEASRKITEFLKSKVLTEDMELITPIENIEFDGN